MTISTSPPAMSVQQTRNGLNSTSLMKPRRNTPTAAAVEEIGYYDSTKNPAQVSLDAGRMEHWISKGAQPSDRVKRLMKAQGI